MDFSIGQILQGEVVAIKPYGAFVRLANGGIGMIHISEIATEYVSDINSYLAVGEEVTVKVIGENAEGKPNLSLKRVTKEELEEARFSREVEEARLALERKNDEILARLKRLKRPKVPQREETLRNWIAEAQHRLEQARREADRRSPARGGRR
ncbi:MAG: S1 RNA-binding domain-containing protein [Candidatus Acetothermia bacterium]|nr:S1 RNA-binding domain-containing protein [Candidatus Acetothermia bacterium]